jgi:hypothetical protein
MEDLENSGLHKSSLSEFILAAFSSASELPIFFWRDNFCFLRSDDSLSSMVCSSFFSVTRSSCQMSMQTGRWTVDTDLEKSGLGKNLGKMITRSD